MRRRCRRMDRKTHIAAVWPSRHVLPAFPFRLTAKFRRRCWSPARRTAANQTSVEFSSNRRPRPYVTYYPRHSGGSGGSNANFCFVAGIVRRRRANRVLFAAAFDVCGGCGNADVRGLFASSHLYMCVIAAQYRVVVTRRWRNFMNVTPVGFVSFRSYGAGSASLRAKYQ